MNKRQARSEMQATAVRQRRNSAPVESAAERRALQDYNAANAAYRASDWQHAPAAKAAIAPYEQAWKNAYARLAQACGVMLD